jgi:hypothetical protein
MRNCEDFEETPGLSPPHPTKDELPINPTAPESFRPGSLKRLAAQMPHHIDRMVDICKNIVITLGSTIFLFAMLAAYHNGHGFQPLKAADVVLKVFGLHVFYTYLRQKILRLCEVLHAWVLHWKVEKQKKDNDTVVIPAQEATARKALVQMWLKSLQKDAEKEHALAEDGEWLVVDMEDARSNSEEDARARCR